MTHGHILDAVFNTPWLIHRESPEWQAIQLIARMRARGERFSAEEIKERIGAGPGRSARKEGAIAVLSLQGPISQYANLMTQVSGGTSTEEFGALFRAVVAEPGVKAVVINVNSPGGSVFGVQELAAEIFQARGVKPIIAVANSMMASAAYWIGSAADEVVVTPGGMAGSVGVVLEHIDISELEKKEGVKTTLISAGKGKTMGNPFEPLSDDDRDELQAVVDEVYGRFVSSVAKNRGVSASTMRNTFQAKFVSAKEAVELGMADRVGTLRDTLKRLGASDAAFMPPRPTTPDVSDADASPPESESQGPSLDTRRRRLRLLEKS
jgi:signal peptide peptidase SppA